MKPTKQQKNRRDFLKAMAAGTAGASLAMGMPARSYARILGANERVNVGIIGTGRMSRGHLESLTGQIDQADVVALCDVYQPNLQYAAARAPAAETHSDFRRVLDSADVDALVVGTPDHWHALPMSLGVEVGKHVYVEKPISVTIAEGRKMVEAARRTGRVVQVGLQQRAGAHFQKVVEIVRSGQLGTISSVRTWNFENEYPEGIGNPPDTAPIPGLDWEMWLGPAPHVPFNINRFGAILDDDLNYTRWASFRWFWDYAGGKMTDWGVHLLDIVQWAMDVQYPKAVSATGGKLALHDNRETPDTLQVTYEYPGFLCTYEHRAWNSNPLDGHGYGIYFYGTAGTLFADRSGYEIIPEEGSGFEAVTERAMGGDHAKHVRNFVEAIRGNEQVICDIETGHRSSSTAILGNIALKAGQRLEWDGQNERVLGNAEANGLLSREYHGPWSLG